MRNKQRNGVYITHTILRHLTTSSEVPKRGKNVTAMISPDFYHKAFFRLWQEEHNRSDLKSGDWKLRKLEFRGRYVEMKSSSRKWQRSLPRPSAEH